MQERRTGERTEEEYSKNLKNRMPEYRKGYIAGFRQGRKLADKGTILSKEEVRDKFKAMIPAAMKIMDDFLKGNKITTPVGMTAKDVVANARSIVDKAVTNAEKGEDGKGIGDDTRTDKEVLSDMRRIIDSIEAETSYKPPKNAFEGNGGEGKQESTSSVRETSGDSGVAGKE